MLTKQKGIEAEDKERQLSKTRRHAPVDISRSERSTPVRAKSAHDLPRTHDVTQMALHRRRNSLVPADVDGVHARLDVTIGHAELGAALATEAGVVGLEHPLRHALSYIER